MIATVAETIKNTITALEARRNLQPVVENVIFGRGPNVILTHIWSTQKLCWGQYTLVRHFIWSLRQSFIKILCLDRAIMTVVRKFYRLTHWLTHPLTHINRSQKLTRLKFRRVKIERKHSIIDVNFNNENRQWIFTWTCPLRKKVEHETVDEV